MSYETLKRILQVGFVSIILGMVVLLRGCSSLNRGIKSLKSDIVGGIDRTVTVYDYNGKEINSWSGKFDVSNSENEVYFDINGKRIIIHGGIIINEES